MYITLQCDIPYVSHVLLVNTIVEKFIYLMADNEVKTAIHVPM